jgi:hypothetical protein
MPDETPKTRRSWWQRFKLSSAHTQANIVCTILIMIATVGYAMIAAFQLKAMSGQLDQLRGSSTQTDKLISLYQQQLAQVTRQAGNTERLAIAAGDQAVAAKTSADTAQSSLRATIDNFHQEQRAWVGVSTLGIPGGTLAEGNTVSAIVTISNLGRTPAQRCYMETGVNLLTPDRPLVIDFPLANGLRHNWFTVPPGDHPNATTEKLKDTNGGIAVLDEAEIAKLKSGDHLFYVFGRIFYKDVFNAEHHTFFCGVMNSDLTTFHNCLNNYHDEN